MTRPLNVVALCGGTWRPSRTLVLTQAVLAELATLLPIQSTRIEMGDIARPLGGALSRDELTAEVESQLLAIEQAERLIVAAPVYRGSYPGLLKHLFDLVGLNALINTPVLLAATACDRARERRGRLESRRQVDRAHQRRRPECNEG